MGLLLPIECPTSLNGPAYLAFARLALIASELLSYIKIYVTSRNMQIEQHQIMNYVNCVG